MGEACMCGKIGSNCHKNVIYIKIKIFFIFIFWWEIAYIDPCNNDIIFPAFLHMCTQPCP